jgi:hypothetical protein
MSPVRRSIVHHLYIVKQHKSYYMSAERKNAKEDGKKMKASGTKVYIGEIMEHGMKRFQRTVKKKKVT